MMDGKGHLDSKEHLMGDPLRLQPLGIGQVLDQAVRLYRRNFLKFIGIFAVVQTPAALLTIIASAQTSTSFLDYIRQASVAVDTPDPDQFISKYILGMGLTLLLAIVSFILVQVIGTAALTKTVTHSLINQPIDILEAYNLTGGDWLRLVGTVFVIAFVALAAVIWMIVVPCVGWITGPSILTFLILVLSPLVIPVIVLEKKSGAGALRRAWDLARRRFWVLIGFALILIGFGQFLIAGPNALVQMIFYTIMNRTQDINSQAVTLTIIQSLVQMIIRLLYNPLQLTAFTLMYYDLRVRAEGLDLALLAHQTSSEAVQARTGLAAPGETAPGATFDYNAVIAHSPPAETGPLLTRGEYGKFTLISVIVIGIYACLFLAFFVFAMALFSMSGF